MSKVTYCREIGHNLGLSFCRLFGRHRFKTSQHRLQGKIPSVRLGQALAFTHRCCVWPCSATFHYSWSVWRHAAKATRFPRRTTSKAFSYRRPDIDSEKVRYLSVCTFCNMIQTAATDGYIKGKQVGQNRWLIDAEVIITSPHNSEYRDTLRFKQHFTPGTDSPNP